VEFANVVVKFELELMFEIEMTPVVVELHCLPISTQHVESNEMAATFMYVTRKENTKEMNANIAQQLRGDDQHNKVHQ